MLPGGLVNIFFALIVYFIFTTSIGKFIGTTVDYVADEGYTAQEAGILPEDKILKINNKTVHFKSDISEILAQLNGEPVTVLIKRDNQKILKRHFFLHLLGLQLIYIYFYTVLILLIYSCFQQKLQFFYRNF